MPFNFPGQDKNYLLGSSFNCQDSTLTTVRGHEKLPLGVGDKRTATPSLGKRQVHCELRVNIATIQRNTATSNTHVVEKALANSKMESIKRQLGERVVKVVDTCRPEFGLDMDEREVLGFRNENLQEQFFEETYRHTSAQAAGSF
ncbi:hypothetical protein I79_006288 [Cricetulus griseus]|uniref:Uncharacterized protein n=1 Tax=Cricetulus griseus TaxID=10029 RepID=G3H7F7_CRIGR|nr:hypothetical protein I79_006288 [Cricetulus griseus]